MTLPSSSTLFRASLNKTSSLGRKLKSVEKIQISLKSDKNKATLHDDVRAFMIPRSVLLSMRNVSDKSCRKIQNTFYVQ